MTRLIGCQLPFALVTFEHDSRRWRVKLHRVSFFIPFRPLLKAWLMSFLGWGVLAFALGSHFVSQMGVPWSEATQSAIRHWLPWAIFTPLLFRLAERLPIDRERWKVTLPVHLVCCVLTVAACEWWSSANDPRREAALRARMIPEQRGVQTPPPPLDPAHPTSAYLARGLIRPRFDLFRILTSRLPIYLAIVSAAHAFLFFGRAQERERRSLGLEASLAKARVEALKMQLQPHFLFNSLNAIAELVHRQPAAAEEMLVALSDLLRLTLSTSGDQELPLSRELEFVERYLAIEHVRYGDRLRFERDIAPSSRDALVPTFLLQPLVENAVRHGLEPRSSAGVLKISARRDEGLLRLTVADNGVGLPGGELPREGIGLGNTRARLRELYGNAATLELHNNHGLAVEIAIPFRTLA